MDLTVQCSPSQKLSLRVIFLAVQEDAILTQKNQEAGYYFLPGGRIRYQEDSYTAVKREIKEELQISYETPALTAVLENFFLEKHIQEHFHEICFLYRIKLPKDFTPPELEEDGKHNEWRWIERKDWNKLNVLPRLSKNHIEAVFNAERFVHIVHKDME